MPTAITPITGSGSIRTTSKARANDYPDVPVVRPVPALMLQPTNGREYVDLDEEGYDEGLPFDVVDRISALYD